jgi:uncharacterized membrane protein YfcA
VPGGRFRRASGVRYDLAMPSLTAVDLAVAAGAVAVGGMIQGVLGFGLVLTAGPIIAFIEPKALPGVFILLGLPMGVWMLLRERKALDVPGFAQLLGGRAVGTLAAFGILAIATPDSLAVVVGTAIVIAAIISWRTVEVPSAPSLKLIAGGVSGLMGTVAAVGGPAMALAYQNREGSELRSTLAATFLVGGLLSLVALTASGFLHWWHVRLSLLMMPAELFGVAASGAVIPYLRRKWLRSGVLLLAGIGGLIVVAKAVL